MRLQAAGILAKPKYDAMTQTADYEFAKPLPKVRVNEPIILSQLATAFFALAMILSVSLIAFLGEFIVAKLRKKRSQDRTIEL